MKLITGFFMAWGNFCAIPCPCKLWDEKARKLMLVMFPVIGLVIGLLWYGLYWLLSVLSLPLPLFAAIMTAYPFIVSGCIHLDGFMDCNDAILSRRPLEERQRILKDSHVGAFAVIAVILLFMVFFASMWSMAEKGSAGAFWYLIFAPILARAASAGAVLTKKPLSTSQYQPSFDKEENRGYKWGLMVIWLLAAAVLAAGEYRLFGKTGLALALAVAVQLAVSLGSGAYARKQLGGMSGDIAGFMLVWSELAAVIWLAVI